MPSLDVTVEMDIGEDLLDCAGEQLLDCAGENLYTAGWRDITNDVRKQKPIRFGQGLIGNGVTDLAAAAGDIEFMLDNSQGNEAGTLGFYSPDNLAVREGFDVGTLVRVKLTDGTNTLYQAGRINSIRPEGGKYLSRAVEVSAADYMEQLANTKIDKIPVQLSKRNDQLIQTVLDNMAIPPYAQDFDTGSDTFDSALNSEQDESTYALTVMQKCVQSELGRLYCRGDSTYGETLVYENRSARSLNVTSKASLVDTMRGLSIRREAMDIWNHIKIVTYPDKVDASVGVLYSMSTELPLTAGVTTVLTARYRDPAGLSNRTSLYPGSEVTPVATTDYKMSSVAGNGGSDLNGNLTISVVWGGNSAEITLTNTGGTNGYVNLLQLRGKGIYHYDPVETTKEDATSKAKYGTKSLTYTMPYQNDANIASDIGDVIIGKHAEPITLVDVVEFTANASDALMEAALTCRVGDRVTIGETVTGIASSYFIQHIDMSVSRSKVLTVQWLLDIAPSDLVFILDDPSHGVLNTNAYLAY